MTATLYTGTWTDTRSQPHLVHTANITSDDVDMWKDWGPQYIAAINSGFYDELIYDIAKACHERHLATNGRASEHRPVPPVDSKGQPSLPMDRDNIPDSMKLGHGDIRPLPNGARARNFTAFGRAYPRARTIGKAFEVEAGVDASVDPATIHPALEGNWVRIEDVDPLGFRVRVLTEPSTLMRSSSGMQLQAGQVLTIPFEFVRYLFTA